MKSYRVPAPWGGIRFLEKDGLLWGIVPELEPAAAPDDAPQAIGRWMALALELLEEPRLLDDDERRALFALPRMRALSDFARRVLAFTSTVPPGRMVSYAEAAQAIGSPAAVRAVGGALAANPFPILIGCHRVASARTLAHLDVLKPETLAPEAYMGSRALSGVGLWLRIADLDQTP